MAINHNTLRVLHAYSGGNVGGVQRVFQDTVRALQGEGIQQHLVLGHAMDLPDPDIPHMFLSFSNRFTNISTHWHMRQAIRQFQPDIIQTWQHRANWFLRGPVYQYAGKSAPVVRFIGGVIGGRRLKKHYTDSAVLLMPSHAVVETMVQAGWDAKKAAVLQHFCDLTPAVPMDRDHYGAVPQGATLVVTAGRLVHDKAFDVLLQAMVPLPHVYLWLLGSGEKEADLRTLAHDLGIEHRVFWLGWQQNVSSHFAAADVVVIPSRYEPFGLVIIEAMAQGKPVLTTRTHGGCEIITDGETGLLCPVDDGAAMTMGLKRLCDHPDLRHSLGRAGQHKVQQDYNASRAMSGLLAMYRGLQGC